MVTVTFPAEVLDAGETVAVSPAAAGDLDVVNATVPVNPLLKASAIVLVADAPPRVRVLEVGEAVKVKARICNETVVVRVSAPLVPVTVIV